MVLLEEGYVRALIFNLNLKYKANGYIFGRTSTCR